jgi:hypothetical protein
VTDTSVTTFDSLLLADELTVAALGAVPIAASWPRRAASFNS